MPITVCEGDERFAFQYKDSRILFHLLPAEAEAQLYAAAVVEGKKGEGPGHFNEALFKRLKCLACADGWEDVVDRQKRPLQFSRAALERLLLGNVVVATKFYNAITDPFGEDTVTCLNDLGERPVPLTEPEKNVSGVQQP